MCVSLFLFAELCGLWQMVIMLKHEQLKQLLFNILLAINTLPHCTFLSNNSRNTFETIRCTIGHFEVKSETGSTGFVSNFHVWLFWRRIFIKEIIFSCILLSTKVTLGTEESSLSEEVAVMRR